MGATTPTCSTCLLATTCKLQRYGPTPQPHAVLQLHPGLQPLPMPTPCRPAPIPPPNRRTCSASLPQSHPHPATPNACSAVSKTSFLPDHLNLTPSPSQVPCLELRHALLAPLIRDQPLYPLELLPQQLRHHLRPGSGQRGQEEASRSIKGGGAGADGARTRPAPPSPSFPGACPPLTGSE
jgi:hypothetical protein